MNKIKSSLLVIAFFVCFPVAAQKIIEPLDSNPQWSQPYPPFRIVGNVYYVGTYDLACYLIVTPKGNILINTGLAASAKIIQQNIETLGYKLGDVRILLTTQAHYDHVGAMAVIKNQTGAKMMIDEKDAGVLADGGSSDYAFGGKGCSFAPVQADRMLKNGDTITLGPTHLVMLHHPGHTKGSCSFLFDVTDEGRTYKVLIVNMPSIITDKKLDDIPAYPDIAKDYAFTFDALKKQSFDIWLSSHASQFGLHTKHKPGDPYRPAAFIDRMGYDDEIRDLEKAYNKKLKQQ